MLIRKTLETNVRLYGSDSFGNETTNKTQDYDLSMKFYELAISLGSTRKKDFYQLANFYKWKGDYDGADRCYTLWELVKARSGIDSDE